VKRSSFVISMRLNMFQSGVNMSTFMQSATEKNSLFFIWDYWKHCQLLFRYGIQKLLSGLFQPKIGGHLGMAKTACDVTFKLCWNLEPTMGDLEETSVLVILFYVMLLIIFLLLSSSCMTVCSNILYLMATIKSMISAAQTVLFLFA